MSSPDLNAKYDRYTINLERVFSELEIPPSTPARDKSVKEIVELAQRYLADAAYFKGRGDLATALISLAYCEGLLDALRLLDYVHFSWKPEGNSDG